MNENKTGAFISALRKEKELTQAQLAEKLNVTDKAVSRWETGKGMPDSSLLIPLADALGITVNELLTGEKIPQEAFTQKTEDNLVEAVQKTENAVKHGKTAKILLAFAVIVCVFLMSLLIKSVSDKQNAVTYVGSINTANRSEVIQMLLEMNYIFSGNAVCTDYTVELNPDGDFKNAKITVNDESAHENISVDLSSSSDKPQKISYQIVRSRNYVSAEDGILFSDLCEFLTDENLVKEVKKYNRLENFDRIYISGQSNLYFNFDGQKNMTFENQHLFDGGKLKKVNNAAEMFGKYYEAVITTFDTYTGASCNCFGVYIER